MVVWYSITSPPPPSTSQYSGSAKRMIFANGVQLKVLTIYAPVIYTAPCLMFWMGAYTLRGEVGGGWALEFPSFLGPVKWERADRRVPFGAQYFCDAPPQKKIDINLFGLLNVRF